MLPSPSTKQAATDENTRPLEHVNTPSSTSSKAAGKAASRTPSASTSTTKSRFKTPSPNLRKAMETPATEPLSIESVSSHPGMAPTVAPSPKRVGIAYLHEQQQQHNSNEELQEWRIQALFRDEDVRQRDVCSHSSSTKSLSAVAAGSSNSSRGSPDYEKRTLRRHHSMQQSLYLEDQFSGVVVSEQRRRGSSLRRTHSAMGSSQPPSVVTMGDLTPLNTSLSMDTPSSDSSSPDRDVQKKLMYPRRLLRKGPKKEDGLVACIRLNRLRSCMLLMGLLVAVSLVSSLYESSQIPPPLPQEPSALEARLRLELESIKAERRHPMQLAGGLRGLMAQRGLLSHRSHHTGELRVYQADVRHDAVPKENDDHHAYKQQQHQNHHHNERMHQHDKTILPTRKMPRRDFKDRLDGGGRPNNKPVANNVAAANEHHVTNPLKEVKNPKVAAAKDTTAAKESAPRQEPPRPEPPQQEPPRQVNPTTGFKRRFVRPQRGLVSSTAAFSLYDWSLFANGKQATRESLVKPRVVSFGSALEGGGGGGPPPPHREMDLYPTEFTDKTQLYGVLDSNDERLGAMELREPLSQGECVPMQEWQTTYHPSCNGMHEMALEHMGTESGDDFKLFGTKGFWRNAWRVDVLGGMQHSTERETLVLKTLKFQHNFEDAHFEHDRIDAVAMERLTASPHVINVFGFCGHSVLTEFADGTRVGELADKSKKKPLVRLKIARDIATGLADVHGIDGDGNATFVHLDINPANVMSIGGTLKLNDFNIGILLRWNTTSNTQCGFPAQYPNPQWRSPEEARNEQNLTEKVDVFSMGHIFFRLICGHEPWNKLEPGGRPSKEEINDKVQHGALPYIPEHIRNTSDDEVAAIRDAMVRCYTFDPKQRPSARQIANELDAALDELSKTTKKEKKQETKSRRSVTT